MIRTKFIRKFKKYSLDDIDSKKIHSVIQAISSNRSDRLMHWMMHVTYLPY